MSKRWEWILGAVRIGVAIALVAGAGGCADMFAGGGNGSQLGAGAGLIPTTAMGDDSMEASVGARQNPRIIATYGGIYDDRPIEAMVAHIVGRLLTAANQPNSKYSVTILDTADVNAFALPGGYIYVTRGMLALANDESELAAVLAHEIAHVVHHDARARNNFVQKEQLADKLASGGMFSGAPGPKASKPRLSLAAFSRAQELAADHTGIEIAGRAGYDPYAASRILAAMGRFSKFSVGDAAQANDFLSSHPSTPDRIEKAVEIARTSFGPRGVGEQDRATYMNAINNMSFGASPQRGAIIGQRYIQPALKFTFTVPDGYKLQVAQSAVVGVAGAGEAVRFDSAEVPADMSLTQYLKSGWIAGLDPKSVTEQTINGMDTASGVAVTSNWSFRVSVVRFDGQVVRFIFAAKSDSPRFARGAAETLQSFRPTTRADLAEIRKVSLKVITAQKGDTADSLAHRMASLSRGTELFFILNNLLPGDPVTAGAEYKLVTVM